jgi:hypothetical protein
MGTVGPTQRTRLHRGWTEQTAEPATEGARRLGHGSFAQSRFLESVRREVPAVLRSLADLAGWNDADGTADLDAERLTEGAEHWNLTDAWCLTVARATAATWVGPSWELLRAECAAEGGDWLDRLDWAYPVAIVMLLQAMGDVRDDKLAPNKAQALAALAKSYRSVYETGAVAVKLDEIDARLKAAESEGRK